MSLLGVLSQGSISNPLTGVKRSLIGNPTSLPSQLPAFRGVPNEPGKPVKAPKLSSGNRTDRGTNVTVPVARVTSLTSIALTSGRLSPGDVCFVRRTPAGFSGAKGGYGGSNSHMGTAAHMLDMFGIDGVNRMLSGSPNGMRTWQIGYNLVKSDGATTVTHSTELMGLKGADGTPALKVLFEHRLDGVIMSNEEPHSFAPTGERDSALFNIAVRGHAATNNGFMDYDHNSAVELYARGKDPLAYIETMRIGSERAADTWHGKIGYDFVAAYTGTYSEFPLQMFDRKARPLDSAYLILRKYNLEDDVIAPRVAVAQAKAKASGDEAALRAEEAKAVAKKAAARTASDATAESEADAEIARLGPLVVAATVAATAGGATRLVLDALAPALRDESGNPLGLPTGDSSGDKAKRRNYLFFQYMPCTTRAFADYAATLKKVDDALSASSTTIAGAVHRVRFGYATDAEVEVLNGRRIARYAAMDKDGVFKHDKMDAVRFEDIFHSAGAWHVGRIVDTRAANAISAHGGPTNTSYRMTVSVNVYWMTRNKSVNIGLTPNLNGVTDPEHRGVVLKALTKATVKPSQVRDVTDKKKGSSLREAMGLATARTLAGKELGEFPPPTPPPPPSPTATVPPLLPGATASPPPPPVQGDGVGRSTGAIIGIVVGGVALVGAGVAVASATRVFTRVGGGGTAAVYGNMPTLTL